MMAHKLEAPRERPILFSGEMVRAILEGRKTQTRRLAKFKPLVAGLNLDFSNLSAGHFCTGVPESGAVLYSRGRGGVWEQQTHPLHCPYGSPGTVLWVRETFVLEWPEMDPPEDEEEFRRWVIPHYAATESKPNLVDQNSEKPIGWSPAIHMPRWASRILLEVTEVRVERLRDISEEDARAEGAFLTDYGRRCHHDWTGPGPCPAPNAHHPRMPGWSMVETTSDKQCLGTPVMAFANAWNSINGKRAPWESNPWVWRLSFRRLEP